MQALAVERQREPDEGAEIASAHPDREGVCCDNHKHPPLLDVVLSLRLAVQIEGERLTTTQAGLVMAASFRT